MVGRLPDIIFYTYFSPYTAHAIKMGETVYPTVEHAYQCQRYDDPKIISEIISEPSPLKAWQASKKYKSREVSGFRQRKREVMKEIMRQKALQHEEVKQALIDSGDSEIVKHVFTYPPGDGFWDDGHDGEGENQMGKIWMEIREELKK